MSDNDIYFEFFKTQSGRHICYWCDKWAIYITPGALTNGHWCYTVLYKEPGEPMEVWGDGTAPDLETAITECAHVIDRDCTEINWTVKP